MKFKATIHIKGDWDQHDMYIEEYFYADSLEEVTELVRKSVLYNEQDMQSALDEEFDYNWCINPDFVEWDEAARHLAALANNPHTQNVVVQVSVEPVAQGTSFDLNADFIKQNKALSDSVKKLEEEKEFERLKKKLGK